MNETTFFTSRYCGIALAAFALLLPSSRAYCAKGCSPDYSAVDKITKQRNQLWTQSVYSTSFGKQLLTDTALNIWAAAGRFGAMNFVRLELSHENLADPTLQSTYRGAKGKRFFFGFKDAAGMGFLVTEVGTNPRSIMLVAALPDKDLAAFREVLTTRRIDAVRIPLTGDRLLEEAVDDGDGRKMMEKFSCFYRFLDDSGIVLLSPVASGTLSSADYSLSAPGKYTRGGPNGDFIELSRDGTFYMSQGGRGAHGTYKIQADVITMQMPNGVANRGRFSGNTVIDPDGTVWERQMEQQKTAQTPLTNDQIIKMVEAKLSDDIVITTVRNSVGKFDLSPEALIRLKAAGVSDAVIRAMTRQDQH